MTNYEAVIILNPNFSSKVDSFISDFESLLKQNAFSITKTEDIGRRQLSFSINNHNKGHYLIFNIKGDATKLIDVENKIKYYESIIRHLFLVVKEHSLEKSQLFIDTQSKRNESKSNEEKIPESKSKESHDDKKTASEDENIEKKDSLDLESENTKEDS